MDPPRESISEHASEAVFSSSRNLSASPSLFLSLFFPSLLLLLSLFFCFSLCPRMCLQVSVCLWKFLFTLINLCVCMHRYVLCASI